MISRKKAAFLSLFYYTITGNGGIRKPFASNCRPWSNVVLHSFEEKQILHIFKQATWFEVSLFPSVTKTNEYVYQNVNNDKD